jgi:hypothetical protein
LRLSPESRYVFRMKPPPLTEQPEMHHLPRLDPECYRGFAVVQWTITLERRATGWLDDRFHLHFRELLLHAAAREGIPITCISSGWDCAWTATSATP